MTATVRSNSPAGDPVRGYLCDRSDTYLSLNVETTGSVKGVDLPWDEIERIVIESE
jgi:hypothetical protein